MASSPLPYTKRFEGLATGVRELTAGQPLTVQLQFQRGALNRLAALASHGCDWAVVSRFVAETAPFHGFSVDIVGLLGPQSYMTDHVLLFGDPAARAVRDGMRIGIDTQSTDHSYVVRTVSRGRAVTFVEIKYDQGLRLIASDVIDATVWSREDVPPEIDHVAVVPIDAQIAAEVTRLSEAAIVVNADDKPTAHVLTELLNWPRLLAILHEVVALARVPTY